MNQHCVTPEARRLDDCVGSLADWFIIPHPANVQWTRYHIRQIEGGGSGPGWRGRRGGAAGGARRRAAGPHMLHI